MKAHHRYSEADDKCMRYGCIVAWWIIHVVVFIPLARNPEGTAGGYSPFQMFFASLLVLNLYLYHKVRNSDPGFLLPDSQKSCRAIEAQVFEPEAGLLEPPPRSSRSRSCAACCILSLPSGAKHCRSCRRCVDGSDHHCIWISNCVGRNNHRLFWSYLGVQALVAAIATHLTLGLFLDHYSMHRDASFPAFIPWSAFGDAALLVFLVIALIVISCLFAFHTYLLLAGQTTRTLVHRWRSRKGASGSRSYNSSGKRTLGGSQDGSDSSRSGGNGGSGTGGVKAAQILKVVRNCVWLVTGAREAPCFQWKGCLGLARGAAAACDNSYYSCC